MASPLKRAFLSHDATASDITAGPYSALTCPTCWEPFRARPHVCVPVRLACGHCICEACLHVLQLSDETSCQLCQQAMEPCAVDIVLAAFAEDTASGEALPSFPRVAHADMAAGADAGVVASPASRDMSAALAAAIVRFGESAGVLLAGDAVVQAAMGRLVHDAKATCDAYSQCVDDVIEAMRRERARVLAEATAVLGARIKALQAQSDELLVSSAQLKGAVVLCERAVACGDPVSLAGALDVVVRSEPLLLKGFTGVSVSTVLDIVSDVSSVLAAIAGSTRLRQLRIDPLRCSAAGRGLSRNDGSAENVFDVTLRDDLGELVGDVTAADVLVKIISSTGIPVPACIDVAAPGVVSVSYRGMSRLTMHVSVTICGADVVAGALAVPCRTEAAGRFVKSYILAEGGSPRGLAVSRDGSKFAVSYLAPPSLSVYATSDGSVIQRLSGRGSGACPIELQGNRFISPTRNICSTEHDTLLVGELENMRVHEVTWSGEHVRYIGGDEIGDAILCVAANAVTVAVGVHSGGIALFDYSTGSLLSRVSGGYLQVSTQCGVFSLRFSPCGTQLAALEENGGVSWLLSLPSGEWQSRKSDGFFGSALDCEFAEAGVLVLLTYSGVDVLNTDNLRITRHWGWSGTGDGRFISPVAMAASDGLLYILDKTRVQVFE